MAKLSFKKVNLRVLLITALLLCLSLVSHAQNANTYVLPSKPDTDKLGFPVLATPGAGGTYQYLTLQQCIEYAMVHQPALNKSVLGVNIARTTNAINLAGWLPQVNASGSAIHYIQLPNNSLVSTGATTGTTATTTGGTTGTTTGTGTTGGTTTGTASTTGTSTSTRSTVGNTFIPELAVSQAILSPELLYASKAAPLLVKQAQEVTDSTKIYLVSAVSKSFYNVLLNLEQIKVLREDTARLGKNLRDTYHQYKGGIVDETDYEEATITLNNSAAQLKQANENVIPLYASLKQLIGYEANKEFNVAFDTLQMIKNIQIDTTKQLQYERRIEYQQVQTRKDLQAQLTHYYRFAYLPTVSAFFNYNLEFANNNFQNLLSSSYPSSLVGVSLNIPIFTGFARVNNVRKSKLQEQQIHWDEVDLKLELNKEYTTALAAYKSNLYNYELLKKNVALAKRVYFVVQLQYKQGIVAYLNVITAESNLITAEISYTNALFNLLSSKIDLEKAMGDITY